MGCECNGINHLCGCKQQLPKENSRAGIGLWGNVILLQVKVTMLPLAGRADLSNKQDSLDPPVIIRCSRDGHHRPRPVLITDGDGRRKEYLGS